MVDKRKPFKNHEHPSSDQDVKNTTPLQGNHRTSNPYKASTSETLRQRQKQAFYSPEEARRRRQERISQLENIQNDQEIEQTYSRRNISNTHRDTKYSDNVKFSSKRSSHRSPILSGMGLSEDENVSAFNHDQKTQTTQDSIQNHTPHNQFDNEKLSKDSLASIYEDDQNLNNISDHSFSNVYIDENKDDFEEENWWLRQKYKRQEKRKALKEQYSLSGYNWKEKLALIFAVLINIIKHFLIFVLVTGLLLGALVGGTGLGYFAALVGETEPPTKQEMAESINRLEQQSTLYYASGQPIANVRSDVVRSVASIDEISPNIINGLISIEDEAFYDHPGVNPKATLRAVLQTFLTGSGTGGSTLTQQLVKQQLLTNDVTFFRKANEILLALRLENYFSKDEILTAYLNVSPFGRNNKGENVAGIREASEGIFGVPPEDVNLAQAAFLVGLPQDPYNYTPYNQFGELRTDNFEAGINRMKAVLYSMYRNQVIDKETYEETIQYDIVSDFLEPEEVPEDRQSYLYQAVMNGAIEQIMALNIEEDGYTIEQVYADDEWYNEYFYDAEEQLRTGGYHVYSTIDKEIYNQLQQSAQAHNDELGISYEGVYIDPNTGEEVYYVEDVQTGMVVIENETGKVLGFVAGTDFENNQIDHAFGMHRSPGSTIKPMAVYAPAIEHDLIYPATVIPDTEFVETYSDGTEWRPTNYGMVVSGDYLTARTALLRSDNIPAVRVYEEIRNQNIPVIDYLKLMGFNTVDSYTEEDTQNLAFSLGGVTTGPTVFEQTSGFTTFANKGNYVEGYYIEKIEDSFGNIVFEQNKEPVRVFSEDTNYLMVDMLRDTNTEGTGRRAAELMEVNGDWIAKSGISENSKDVWYIASTPKITIGSWIGYDSQYGDFVIDINDGYGGESLRSQTFWANVVNDLYALRPEIFGTDLKFEQPESVVKQSILEKTGTLPGTVRINNRQASLSGPLREDVFKRSNPAAELTYDFLFNASDEELQRFWAAYLSNSNQRQRNNNSQSGETNGNHNGQETTTNPISPSDPSEGDTETTVTPDPTVPPDQPVEPETPPGGEPSPGTDPTP